MENTHLCFHPHALPEAIVVPETDQDKVVFFFLIWVLVRIMSSHQRTTTHSSRLFILFLPVDLFLLKSSSQVEY